MKSMLYVGATLMIGASIYGFVDYKQTSREKQFTNMYETKDPPVMKEVEIPVVEKKEVVAPVRKSKTRVNKVKSLKKDAETVIIPVAPIAEEARITGETKSIEKTSVDVKASKQAAVKKSKRKKLDHRIFSRARPRDVDEIVEEPAKAKVVKKESKKD